MDEDLRKMRKAELMKYAASIGVKTRREGGKVYRPVEEVRADCATARQATGRQPPPADAPAEPPDEFEHMRQGELKQAAVLLRVSRRKAGALQLSSGRRASALPQGSCPCRRCCLARAPREAMLATHARPRRLHRESATPARSVSGCQALPACARFYLLGVQARTILCASAFWCVRAGGCGGSLLAV